VGVGILGCHASSPCLLSKPFIETAQGGCIRAPRRLGRAIARRPSLQVRLAGSHPRRSRGIILRSDNNVSQIPVRARRRRNLQESGNQERERHFAILERRHRKSTDATNAIDTLKIV